MSFYLLDVASLVAAPVLAGAVVAGGAVVGCAGNWTAEGGGGREIDASVASMACWMADDGADDCVVGIWMPTEPSSGLKQHMASKYTEQRVKNLHYTNNFIFT